MLEDIDDTSDILSTPAPAVISTTNSTFTSSIDIYSALGLSHRFEEENEEPESEVKIYPFTSNSDKSTTTESTLRIIPLESYSYPYASGRIHGKSPRYKDEVIEPTLVRSFD